MVRDRFRKGPGYKQVQTGLYEFLNGKDVQQVFTTTEYNGLLPGMEIKMSIILMADSGYMGEVCPKSECAAVNTTPLPNGERYW